MNENPLSINEIREAFLFLNDRVALDDIIFFNFINPLSANTTK